MNDKLEEEKLLKKLKEAGLPVVSVRKISKEEIEKILSKKTSETKERAEQ